MVTYPQSDDLVTWLRAQLDDDERAATIISPGGYDPQSWRAGPDGPGHVGVLLFADDHVIGDPPGAIDKGAEPFAIVIGGRAEHGHIARWDPARVLAEVDAKRRMLDMVVPGRYEGGYGEAYLDMLRLLALPYADRPGYRDEWRP